MLQYFGLKNNRNVMNKKNLATSENVCKFVTDFDSEITKRYASVL